MKPSKLFLMLSLLTLVSCNKPKIIPQNKMIELMTEMHQLDIVVAQSRQRYDAKSSQIPAYYQYIMDKAGVNRTDYEQSLAYYAQNDTLLAHMYDAVITHLNQFKVEVEHGSYYSLTTEELGITDTVLPTLAKINLVIKPSPPLGKDIWAGKNIYRIPMEGNENPVAFDIRPRFQDSLRLLNLVFSAKIYKDDLSKSPKALLIAEYPKSNDTLSVDLKSSNRWENYRIDYTIRPNEQLRRIVGTLFKTPSDTLQRHAIFWDPHLYNTK